jgi:hypothetical protein
MLCEQYTTASRRGTIGSGVFFVVMLAVQPELKQNWIVPCAFLARNVSPV